MRKAVVVFGVLVALASCASTGPRPTLVGNNYYMTGDVNCVRYREHNSGTHIMCGDKNDRVTGQRFPMTPDQLQAHNAVQAQRYAADMAVANQALQNSKITPNTYQPMVVQQPANLNNRSQVRCLSTGFYTSCQQY